jgi:hypothetical protein
MASLPLVSDRVTHSSIGNSKLGLTESGLVLTPGDGAQAVGGNDGYLSTSDVAELILDADWVILSACNTASGTSDDPEALADFSLASITRRSLSHSTTLLHTIRRRGHAYFLDLS